jgi:hypothetical protein
MWDDQALPSSAIARAFQTSKQAVVQRAYRMGLTRRRPAYRHGNGATVSA